MTNEDPVDNTDEDPDYQKTMDADLCFSSNISVSEEPENAATLHWTPINETPSKRMQLRPNIIISSDNSIKKSLQFIYYVSI